MTVWDPARRLLDEAVATGLIPGAVLAAGRGDRQELLYVVGDAQHDDSACRPMTADTVFDLASLTKVVSTTPCVLHLVEAGELALDDPVRRHLPAFAEQATGQEGKADVTVRQLLSHTAGLPHHRPYFESAASPGEVRAAALSEPLIAEPGTAFCYSDIGFICLGELASAVAVCGLDELVTDIVCDPLGMSTTRYRPPVSWRTRTAATEVVDGVAKTGVVHDENAEALGGVAGHAGLFGTAADLVTYVKAWLGDQPGILSGSTRIEALRCQTEGLAGRRGLGWGLRGDPWDNMGSRWPSTGASHTGFTGTCLSMDPVTQVWLVLLTNRVHFGRGPEHSVVPLRKRVHDAVFEALQNV